MLVRRSAKFRGNSWRKSCEESRRKGAAARPSGGSLENLESVEDFICDAPAVALHPSAPMAVKPRPHTLARAADRSSVRTPPPPPPIPGKVRVTPARTGGPSHRYVVGKNKLWFANATRTPPPPNRADAPGTASPPLLFPAVRGHGDRYKVPGPTGHNQPGLEQLCTVYF